MRPREFSLCVGVLYHVDVQVLEVVVNGLEIAQDAGVAVVRVTLQRGPIGFYTKNQIIKFPVEM